MGRLTVGATERLSKATYQFGKGGPKEGFHGIVHRAEEKHTQYAASLKQSEKDAGIEKGLNAEKKVHEDWEKGDKKKAEAKITETTKENAAKSAQRTTALKAQQAQVGRAEQLLAEQEEKVTQTQAAFTDIETRTQAAEAEVTQQQQVYAAAQAAGDQNAIRLEQANLVRAQNTHGQLAQRRDDLRGRLAIETDVLTSRTTARDAQQTALATLTRTQAAEAAADAATLKGLKDDLEGEVRARNADKRAIEDAILKVDGNAARRAYVSNIKGTGIPILTVENIATHHAVTKIAKGYNKKESEKLMDALKGVTDATNKAAGGGGGSTH